MTLEQIIEERKSYRPPTVEEALEWFPDASPVTLLPSPDRFGYPAREFAETFPKSKSIVKKEITKLNEQVRSVNDHVDAMRARYHRQTDKDMREKVAWFHESLVIPTIELDIKWYTDVLFFLDLHKKPAQVQQFDHDVQKAKTVPIDRFIDFNSAGKANCLWHDEKTPSMQYYKKDNKVFCFGCNNGGDAIDVVSILYDKTFNDAVAFLNQ